MNIFSTNTPLVLTFLRLIISPIVLPAITLYFLPYNTRAGNLFVGLLFVALAFTDFLDGYLARKLGKQTQLGALVDPIADKFLIASLVIPLVALGKVPVIVAVILICREMFVMGLREIAQAFGFSVEVARGGKLKTVLQVTYLAWVIMIPHHHAIENCLLLAALVSTCYSAFYYYQDFMTHYDALSKNHDV